MKFSRRTFLKTSGTIIASLLAEGKARPVGASRLPGILPGREIPGRCPLCSLGCGMIYRARGLEQWTVEGDPDCPVASGSLCSRGAALLEPLAGTAAPGPLYRAPGGSAFKEISLKDAVHTVARRLKDLRDRDLGILSPEGDQTSNRFESIGVIAGGCLTNEEAYLASKLFRALGVTGLDTTVRASHGMAVTGLLDTLGFPGATHPVTQVAYSDVVVLVGCNPGQTAPALCRFLDKVRERRGIVIVIDPRRSETVRKDDLWLQLRPGTDNAVLGAMVHWVLQYAEINKPELVEHSDAAFITKSQIMGEYERHPSGKYKNWKIVDDTLAEPYSIFQRMKEHYKRYDLRKISSIAGVDPHLLRRACNQLARTASADFSATFILGSGVLASPSGEDAVRMAASVQALLGNLDKKGGGVILATAAANAQGVCDMGLLGSYLPGYIPLPRQAKGEEVSGELEPLDALVKAWYPMTEAKKARGYLPRLLEDENPSLSTIVQAVGDEQVRALIAIGSDPLSSLPDTTSMAKALGNLDLLVVMDSTSNRLSRFWQRSGTAESVVKTEVIYIPTEPPALKRGSMTDSGRRVRSVVPVDLEGKDSPGLLTFLVSLGNSIRSKYEAEGGVHADPLLELDWALTQTAEDVAAEINGWRAGTDAPLPPGRSWQKGDRCGNHLYRGWVEAGTWAAQRRDPVDADGAGLHEKWGWFWPWGIVDPFSWVREPGTERGAFLRWKGQGHEKRTAADVLPLRAQLPVKFWKLVHKGSPFPEHHEPFHSPLPDYLTGGHANPHMQLRREIGDPWGYLSRRPEEVLQNYPVIIMIHRTGNVMGTGGITTRTDSAMELGVCRIVEIGPDLAGELRVRTGDDLLLFSPFSVAGVRATAQVTGRIGTFQRDRVRNHVASVTLYGREDEGINVLTPPAFDFSTGGMEIKVFMGRIVRAGT